MANNPSAFISYAWENDELKLWVKNLATRLRQIGIDAKIDQWEVLPGDQLPHFMERSVRDNDYVLIICTPIYKSKSDNRVGGVGYEGDIMTAEALQSSNHRKFIPILKSGKSEISIPSWLKGKYFIDLSDDNHFENNIEDLITTLLNIREIAPKLGSIPDKYNLKPVNNTEVKLEEDIKIKGIIVDEVTEPLNNDSRGSALYKIPFELNRSPNYQWVDLFINAWNRPALFTSMHRPGIASVSGKKIILNGTTIEEVEKYHKATLKLAVGTANQQFNEIKQRERDIEEKRIVQTNAHKNNIRDISGRISFDD